ncbi:MAG: hypothetical protein RIR58_131 [Actinomycetota bacterium]
MTTAQDLAKYSLAVKETLKWPIWIWFLILSLDISIALAVWAALGEIAVWIALILTLALTGFFYQFTKLRIEFVDEKLKVGRAQIEKQYLADVEPLNEEQMRFLRGPGINPAAFLALRFWVKGGIKITLNDQRDPTPYWLVSTKNPEKLKKAIED